MSSIKWLTCPACAYRFYIVEEHAGHGFVWFCPSCKHEFREEDQRAADAAQMRTAASM